MLQAGQTNFRLLHWPSSNVELFQVFFISRDNFSELFQHYALLSFYSFCDQQCRQHHLLIHLGFGKAFLIQKNDWGFLEKGSKHLFLRNRLCYKNSKVYYAALASNLILRYAWTLTISPSVYELIPKSTFLPLVTGVLQILRRCMWNFFRIEKEHVMNCDSFTRIKPELS